MCGPVGHHAVRDAPSLPCQSAAEQEEVEGDSLSHELQTGGQA